MKALTILSILIGSIIFCNVPSYIQAATYYVDGNYGSDTNPGTLNAPWKKIAKANNTLRAGDTVYIKSGVYSETIRPANSGNADNYITFTAYNGETVTIGGNITDGADLSDRSWVKIEGLQFIDTNHSWINFKPNGSHHLIVDNAFESTGSSMGWNGLNINQRSNYNKIINNSFTAACHPDDLVNIYDSSYNLVEGNYFGDAAHTALGVQNKGIGAEYNIIRNNTFQNRFHHNLGIMLNPTHTLVEGNRILDAGDACSDDSCPQNSCGSDRDRSMPRYDHSGLQMTAKYSIIRNNVVNNNGRFAMEAWSSNKTSVDNRIYNNTFSGNYFGFRVQTDPNYAFTDNILKNNIFIDNIDYNVKFGASVSQNTNQFINNAFFGGAPVSYKYKTGIKDIQTTYTSEWKGNYNLNSESEAGFTDRNNRNFSLSGNSKLIDAGTWLTTITSSTGTSNSFLVADSRYFSDGFGIIPGDIIQIEGQKTIMRITKIDYDTNKIVVDRSISWTKGDSIGLQYTGNSPDIGAFEYGLSTDRGYGGSTTGKLAAPSLSIKK